MKRTGRMEYMLNENRSHVIERKQLARNPIEVGVDVDVANRVRRISLQVFVDGTYELSIDGLVIQNGDLA